MELKDILVIDGSNMMHRALKTPVLFETRNANGMRIGGIQGFFNILQKELKKDMSMSFPIVCWDDDVSERRLTLYNNYKKHLDKIQDPNYKAFCNMTDEELDENYDYQYKLQRKRVIEILKKMGIPSLLFSHTEGDDLIKWVVDHSKKSKIISDDGDMLQLISANCKIRQPMHNRVLTINNAYDGCWYDNSSDYVREKALLGDKSDNIPSACYQVGKMSTQAFFEVFDRLNSDDNLDIMSNCEALENYCKTNNLLFKKAFVNFNIEQYLTNLELVDLGRIHVNDLDENAIIDTIINAKVDTDIKDLFNILKCYKLSNLDVNSIVERVMMTSYNVKQ